MLSEVADEQKWLLAYPYYLTTSVSNITIQMCPVPSATDLSNINILLTIHCNFPNTLFALVGYLKIN